MYTGKTAFAQLFEHLPLHQFRLCVKRYSGNRKQCTHWIQPRSTSVLRCFHGQSSEHTRVRFKSAKEYPDKMRRIKYVDQQSGKSYVFLTNNFELAPKVTADLYKSRWQIELFFKWIKQHLRIKAFYRTSENAVKTQFWTAISVYVLIALSEKETQF